MRGSMAMHMAARPLWLGHGRPSAARPVSAGWRERTAAMIGLVAFMAWSMPIYFPAVDTGPPPSSAPARDARAAARSAIANTETLLGGYVGVPYHARSDVHLQRPGGTDLTLKGLQWDAEPFKFPLYAGLRAARWHGPFGYMIEFLHDKAVSRTGRGAHGSRVTGERAIPDILDAIGTLKGQPAPAKLTLTDVVERLEFTHGHNMILPTAMVRVGSITSAVRPYFGLGGGVALPHVEIWPAGEGEPARTNEYQVAGPAVQALAGLEIRTSWGTVFVEYKYTFAWLSMALTGGKTPKWCNCDGVSDLWRQLMQWWRAEVPKFGRASTALSTHQVVGGATYRLTPRATPP